MIVQQNGQQGKLKKNEILQFSPNHAGHIAYKILIVVIIEVGLLV